MANFFDDVLQILKHDNRFFSTDGKFLRNAVYQAAMQLDKNLLRLLLDNIATRKYFFQDVDGVLIFDKIKFGWLISNKKFLPNSYTRYKNKIGLVDEHDNFISQTNNIELVFPYKDCLLEGGQTKDDQKRQEIFYNELLAPDDIDRLLEPKVFTNAKKFSNIGVQPVQSYSGENLIIKGNNLIALACINKIFAAKIKCIYIDVPYNTGNDSFGYNDKFNHSTWLTFMKNRLDFAKKLLRNDGSIWISIDDDEQAYLKILCDEIFGRNNFVCNVIWEKKYSPQNDAKYLSDSHDFILVYAKDKNIWRPNLLPRTDEMNARYSNPDNDPRGLWTSADFTAKRFTPADCYPITLPSGRIIYPTQGRSWISGKKKFDELVADNRIYFGENGNNVPRVKKFLSEVQQGLVSKTVWKIDEVGDNQAAKREVKNLDVLFDTPKPTKLIEKILKLATDKNSIILDSFAGSGTTAHAVLNLNAQDGGNRKFILIELNNYAENITAERVKRVGGEFNFYEIGESLFDEDGFINNAVPFERICEYIYFAETGKTFVPCDEKNLMGVNDDTAYYYFGGENLSWTTLAKIKTRAKVYVIYADACNLSEDELMKYNIHFRQIPFDVRKY